jgi:hypothetical protein
MVLGERGPRIQRAAGRERKRCGVVVERDDQWY